MEMQEQTPLELYADSKTVQACLQVSFGEFSKAADTLEQLAAVLRSHQENQLIAKHGLAS